MKRFAAALMGMVLISPVVQAQTMPRMDLAQSVRQALLQNPDIQDAHYVLTRAEALVSQSRAALFPTVTGSGIYTHLDSERVLGSGDTRRVVAGQNQVRGELQLIVPILAPLALDRARRAEGERREAVVMAADLRRQVAVSTARAFLSVVAQRRVIVVGEQARDTAKAHHHFAATRLAGGVGRAIDEVRADQELATAEAQIEIAQSGLAHAQEALGLLVGASGPVDAQGDPDIESVAGAQARSLPDPVSADSRSDVAVARAHIKAADRAIRDRWTQYAPYLSLVGIPYFQKPASLTNPELGWLAQLVLTVPIWDGGRRSATFREQDVVLSQAQLEVDTRLRQARAEIRSAFASVIRGDSGLLASRRAADAAQKALHLATLAYTAGATSNIEVVDAERRARDAQTAATVAEDTARLARLELLAASGRFPGAADPKKQP